jgi:hypothetical protein
MEKEITITRGALINALRDWEKEAKAGSWSARDDYMRFTDSADYLLAKMCGPEAPKR